MLEKFIKNNNLYFFIIPIIFVSAILISRCIHLGHNWSGDYALYIQQTQSILNGTINELYALSKFSNEHAYRIQGPYLYPMGFPLLLIVPYYFWGLNFFAMKVFSSLFFLGSLLLLYRLFRSHFAHVFYPLCIVAAIAFHHEYITFSDNVYSDFTFLFFSTLVFLCMQKENTLLNQILLGFLLFFTYSIRDVGILLLPVLLVYQFQSGVLKIEINKRWYSLLPYVVFGVLFLLNALLLPKGNENHFELLWSKLSLELILKNSLRYVDLLASYFFINRPLFLVLLVLLISFFAGVFFTRGKEFHFVVFIFLLLLIHIIWPGWQGMRFVFPILPLILYFIVKGFEQLFVILKIKQRYLAFFLFCAICFMSFHSYYYIRVFSRIDSNLAYNEDAKLMYGYISKNIPKDEVIGFDKPRILRLFTNRNCILSDIEHFEQLDLKYLLIRKLKISKDTEIPYTKVYETFSLILVRR